MSRIGSLLRAFGGRAGDRRTPRVYGPTGGRDAVSGNGPRNVAVTVVVGALTLAVVYQRWVWPWQLRWGATDAEVARSMAGDVVVAAPDFVATRAITIAAPADAVWPW